MRAIAPTLVLFVAVFVTVLGAASEVSAMRCGTRLVARGDTTAHVLEACGEPTRIDRRTETRTRIVSHDDGDGVSHDERVTYTVVIERWIYDLGPRRLVRSLLIDNGRVQRIDVAGRGSPGNRPR